MARLYYINDSKTQKEIAEKVGVSVVTISKWSNDGKWEEMRAAKYITRREVADKMLKRVNEKLDSGEWTADEMIKCANAIEKLDKKTNAVTVIEVFTSFNKWMIERMKVDQTLTPDIVHIITKYQDLFVCSIFNKTVVDTD